MEIAEAFSYGTVSYFCDSESESEPKQRRRDGVVRANLQGMKRLQSEEGLTDRIC